MLRTSFGLQTWCILRETGRWWQPHSLPMVIWKFLLRAGKFTKSFQCLLIYVGCGDVITWIRTKKNFSQWTDSTNNYGQGLSSLTLRLCTLFRNMKCDKVCWYGMSWATHAWPLNPETRYSAYEVKRIYCHCSCQRCYEITVLELLSIYL
jgi:hypothetical protein